MKRMIDEKLIEKINSLNVEEIASAIEKANNSLQLPSEAPATDKMVVINDEGEQELQDIPQASGGTQLYKHTIEFICGQVNFSIILTYVSTSNVALTKETFQNLLSNELNFLFGCKVKEDTDTYYNLSNCTTLSISGESVDNGSNTWVWVQQDYDDSDTTIADTVVAL